MSAAAWEVELTRAFSDIGSAFERSLPVRFGRRVDPAEFRTTLGLAVAIGDWIVAALVGDAFLVVGDSEGKVHLPVPPERLGTDASQTVFLTARSTPKVYAIFDPSMSGAILSTDGLEKQLVSRIVQKEGGKSPVPCEPVRETFASMLVEVRNGLSGERLAEILGADEFRRAKGDDIGVAVVAF